MNGSTSETARRSWSEDVWRGDMDVWRGKVDDWRGDVDGWRGKIDDWRDDVDGWRGKIDAWRGKIDDWRGDVDNWRGKIDDWRGDVDIWRAEVGAKLDSTASKEDIAKLEVKMGEKFAALETRLTLRLFWMMGIMLSVAIGVLRLLMVG